MANLPLISVCICTYKRPEMLSALLQSLAEQRNGDFAFEIIVVDNDRNESAKPVVDAFTEKETSIKLLYEVEEVQGISHARNRTVRLAQGEFIAFIDDDESAGASWLGELFKTMQTEKADAVFGPVVPAFPTASKRWAIESKLFERPRFHDTIRVNSSNARTSNALVRAVWCNARSPYCFALKFSQSGGEDHDFFKWVEEHGGRFFWCDTAIVSELVPLERQSIKYILARRLRASVTYWQGRNGSRIKLNAIYEAIKGAIAGTTLCVAGLCLLPFGFGNAVRVWAKAMNGFGRALALTNVRLVGYKDLNA